MMPFVIGFSVLQAIQFAIDLFMLVHALRGRKRSGHGRDSTTL